MGASACVATIVAECSSVDSSISGTVKCPVGRYHWNGAVQRETEHYFIPRWAEGCIRQGVCLFWRYRVSGSWSFACTYANLDQLESRCVVQDCSVPYLGCGC